jgi:hypothetical protein
VNEILRKTSNIAVNPWDTLSYLKRALVDIMSDLLYNLGVVVDLASLSRSVIRVRQWVLCSLLSESTSYKDLVVLPPGRSPESLHL